jgi:hypothetical protein
MICWLLYEIVRCHGLKARDGWHGTWSTDLGLWMGWKGSSCMDRDGGWIGKVPGIRYGLWKVLLELAKEYF